jgi:hypothetical protein
LGDEESDETYEAYMNIMTTSLSAITVGFAKDKDNTMPNGNPNDRIQPPKDDEPIRANTGGEGEHVDHPEFQLRPRELQLDFPYENPTRTKTKKWASDSIALGIPTGSNADDVVTKGNVMIINTHLPPQIPGFGGPGGNGGAGGYGGFCMPPSKWPTNPSPWQWGSGVWHGTIPARTSGTVGYSQGEGNQVKGQDGGLGSSGFVMMMNWRDV